MQDATSTSDTNGGQACKENGETVAYLLLGGLARVEQAAQLENHVVFAFKKRTNTTACSDINSAIIQIQDEFTDRPARSNTRWDNRMGATNTENGVKEHTKTSPRRERI